MLKSLRVVVVVGGLEQFSVSPRPLGFGFGTKGFGAKGLGPGLDNISMKFMNTSASSSALGTPLISNLHNLIRIDK